VTRKALCCCGACSIEVEGDPAINAICHCANCKRRTGSAFGAVLRDHGRPSAAALVLLALRHDPVLEVRLSPSAHRHRRRLFRREPARRTFRDRVQQRPLRLARLAGRLANLALTRGSA